MSHKALFLTMIFILVVLLSQAFVAPAMGASRKTRAKLRRRIKTVAKQTDLVQLSLARRQYLASLRPWERRLESLPALEQLRGLIDSAGLEWAAYRLVLLALLTAGAVGLAATLRFADPLMAAGGGVLGFAAPFVWLVRKRSQRLRQFEEELPDGINLLSRSLRAGMPLAQALQIAADEIHGPVGAEFGLVFSEINYGGDTRLALMRFLERMPIVPVMALVSSIMIQRESGGNLSNLLDRIEKLLRQRFRFERRVKTLTASNRMAAWVVSLTPFLLAGMMEMVSPGWMTGLIENPTGRQLALVAFGMEIAGILWIQQMTRIKV